MMADDLWAKGSKQHPNWIREQAADTAARASKVYYHMLETNNYARPFLVRIIIKYRYYSNPDSHIPILHSAHPLFTTTITTTYA